MVDIKNKKWPFSKILIISLIINGLIGSSNFYHLNYAGDAVGPILELFKQIEILAYSFGISIVLVYILFLFKKLRLNYIAIIITYIISGCLAFIVSFQLANPSKPTPEELTKKRMYRDQKQAKKVNRLKKKIQFFLPQDSIVHRDTTNLIRELKAILSFGDTLKSEDKEEAIQLELVNHVFNMNFQPESIQYISQYRNSLRSEFVTYSRDYKQFLTVLTYKPSHQAHVTWYNGIIMTCKKEDQKTLCFTTYIDYEKKYSRESYMNDKLAHLFGYVKKEKVNDLWGVAHVSAFIPINVEEYKKHKTGKYYSKGEDINTEIGRTLSHMTKF